MTIGIWDTASWQQQEVLRVHSGWVNSIAFSHDSKLLASGSADKTVIIWDTATWQPQQTLWGHSSWINFYRLFARFGIAGIGIRGPYHPDLGYGYMAPTADARGP